MILDNDEARATNVRFAPGAREPIHSHPFDLVLVQLTPAKMEVQVGDEKTVKDYDIRRGHLPPAKHLARRLERAPVAVRGPERRHQVAQPVAA